MPKISVKLGITLPGPQQYSSFRADFGISDLDTDGDVEAQLEAALEAGEKASVQAEAGLAQQAANVSGITLEGVGVGQAFADFREKFQPAWKKLVEKVKELEERNTTKPGQDREPEPEEEDKPKAVVVHRPKKRGK